MMVGYWSVLCRCMHCIYVPDATDHVGYLKVWQLSQPEITDYDCLLVDEAQDLNPGTCLQSSSDLYSKWAMDMASCLQIYIHAAIMSVVENSPCAKIVVGDPHQQIYGFRGAKEVMELTNGRATQVFYLTQVQCMQGSLLGNIAVTSVKFFVIGTVLQVQP